MTCRDCGTQLQHGDWPFCPHGSIYRQAATNVHPSERSVIYEHPGTGKVVYPGRADRPMAQRYIDRGYERREFTTSRDLEKFEKSHKVANERHWCNSGNEL